MDCFFTQEEVIELDSDTQYFFKAGNHHFSICIKDGRLSLQLYSLSYAEPSSFFELDPSSSYTFDLPT